MKIATNVHRNAFGGITISNLALFDWLQDKDVTLVGIEYINARHFLGAVIFRHYLPSFFTHHIVNGLDIVPRYSWETTWNVRKKWGVLIETTKDVLRKEAPDVILINGTYFSPWILAQAAHELGIPIVLRYAGILQKEIGPKNPFIRRKLLGYERWISEVSQAVIFPSTLCKNVVEAEITGQPVKNGIVIPNPVQPPQLSTPRRSRHSRYAIAFVGRWTPIKNFPAFLAAHEKLNEEGWAHRAILVTSRRDSKFPIPESIEWHEQMDQEELWKFYQTVDLVVVPSHFETFCNVAAEAVVSGCSVLVSEHVGFAEVLKHAGLGRMVIPSFDDPDVVARAIKRLSKTKLSKKERDAVARLVDPQEVHENIVSVLESVLER